MLDKSQIGYFNIARYYEGAIFFPEICLFILTYTDITKEQNFSPKLNVSGIWYMFILGVLRTIFIYPRRAGSARVLRSIPDFP
jgi:hypothetical protein